MKHGAIIICLAMLACVCAVAQDAGKTPGDQAAPSAQPAPPVKAAPANKDAAKPPAVEGAPADAKAAAPAEAKEAAPAESAPEPTGDVVTLKSGKVLSGVQVVSRSPTDIEVDVGGGVTMRISRKQIADIKFDKIEPGKARQGASGEADAKSSELIQGTKIKPEVSAKLTAAIPDPPLKYDNQDIVVILGDLSKRLDIAIIVDDPVKALPDKDRLWTFQSVPGMTLMSLLQDHLLKQFAGLGVVYQFDKLLVTTKEAADAIASKEAPAAEKPADAKPADAKPADAKPADAKPADAKPADAKPAAGASASQ